jgi:RHS repeat-associated protein
VDERRESVESQGAQGPSSAPALTLPTGGGAIRGMGEKFSAVPSRGTGSVTVPIATTPGRAGFGPQLSLSYDSGAGNGMFGVGWQLPLPQISRKTDKGLPQYIDAQESDVFILSGAEDLVPVLGPDGRRHEDTTTAPGYTIHRYRPRIEGLFAKIERWTSVSDAGDVHWRAISGDNVLTVYGKHANARIADPARRERIFSWLICEVRDDKGNASVYEYKAEDATNVELTQAHERNRGGPASVQRTANRYIKRIRYGNRTPLLDASGHRPHLLTDTDVENAGWMFEVVFDYGEHDVADPKPRDSGGWRCRHDPFSSYRAGFEIRTYRLCQRILVFHHFPLEAGVGQDCLVRSMSFAYEERSFAAFITAITQTGHKRASAGGYITRSLPPLEFEYSKAVIGDEVRDIDPPSIDNLPSGVDGGAYQWVDLDGEGLSGVLTQLAGGWFYKRNESTRAADNPADPASARFGPVELVPRVPGGGAAAEGRWQFLDLAGDGQVDLVELDSPTSGFYERTADQDWEPFRTFRSLPNLRWNDPNLKFIDLTGDGHADVLVTDDEAFTWYPSLAEDGFGRAMRVSVPVDEERGARVIFADATQTIYLADLSGDGLTDIVRIRNGDVCYWPNLGYGLFGAKITMDRAPWFDAPDQFDPRRIRLADIDGSGATDIIYLGRIEARFWFNQSGNSWSAAQALRGFPCVDNVASVSAIDLLGKGTVCLVWSSPLPNAAGAPMKYLDLMVEGKPHLLVRTRNNLGAETLIRYAPSTYFYLHDKFDGNPWMTRLPFPVQVVERVETVDSISRNRFVTRYAYHHGYFDGVEREFRGFGMVEQWDTEERADLVAADGSSGANVDLASHVPPVLTRTWFHVGIYLGRERVSNYFAGGLDANDRGEYYREPGLSDAEARRRLLDDTVLPDGLTLDEEREACRALKGSMLRQEVYGLDGSAKAAHPYTVTEQNFTIEVLQRLNGNRYAVFLTHAREALTYHYDRNPDDPRVAHMLTLEVDEFGNVLKQASIGYGRRQPDTSLPPADRDRQTKTFFTYTENRVTNGIDNAGNFRTPLPCEARTYELTGLTLPNGGARVTLHDALGAGLAAAPIPYEQIPATGMLQKRLMEHVRTLYRRDDLTGALPLGSLESLALPFESYTLALTAGLVANVYGGRVTDGMLATEARCVHSEGDNNWWTPSGQMFYSPDDGHTPAQELLLARAHFFLRRRYRDPFHTALENTQKIVTYDRYDLLVEETVDPFGNRVTAGERHVDPTQPLVRRGLDYRVLQPTLVMDANRNRAMTAFDALGMVAGTAVMGKPLPAPAEGDSLEGFDADLTDPIILEHLANPLGAPAQILARATTRLVYDLFAYYRTRELANPEPPVMYTLVRETHDSDPVPSGGLRCRHSFSYSDGFGREIQKKVRAEAGPVPQRDSTARIIVDDNGQPLMTPNDVEPRWVGSGWTIFNNKGKPVRQYEPFFTDTHRFEFDARAGVSPVLFYDPVDRVVATLHPNRTWDKVVCDPWRKETWDVNDTVLVANPARDPDVGDFFGRLSDAEYLPTWHTRREGGALGTREQEAARKAAVHANTPTIAYTDSLGRAFLTVGRNRFKYGDAASTDPPIEEFSRTRVMFDIEGNEREVVDAKDRLVTRYEYDLRGNRISQVGMDSGRRLTLQDAAGKPLYAWDDRDHRFRTAHDVLRRPTASFLREGTGSELLVTRTVYGEARTNSEADNVRGRVIQFFDQAGVLTNERYDFKGNILQNGRQLAETYSATLNWSGAAVGLEPGTFVGRTRYDALNRPTELTEPDGSVVRPGYNDAGLLGQVDVNLRGASQNGQPVWTPFITNIDYDAKGRRTRIDYGNSVTTTYTYDPLTLRLTHLLTRRDVTRFPDDCPQSPPTGWPGCQVQNLHYTYDPAGNITHVRDDAQQTRYFQNQRVEPSADFIHDALYRLIEATGREHLGQTGASPAPGSYNDRPRIGRLLSASDGNAMGRYVERYLYDKTGNFTEVIHRGTVPTNPGWTRTYIYDEVSPLDPAQRSNRLTGTVVGGTTETYSTGGNGYDPHGNMLRMPHLQSMRWEFKEQLQMTVRQAVDKSDQDGVERQGERTWFVYDVSGQRIRKVTELANGQMKDERIYIGGVEIYRRRGASPLVRETLHVMAGSQRIALVETRTSGNEPGVPAQLTRFQFGNHLGSATLELDDEGHIVSYEEYTPFGSTSHQAVRSQTETPKRYRFTGKERDQESGLYYQGARYYAPWLGRWTSADPMGMMDGTNLFAYARNKPIVLSDPTGTTSRDEELPSQALDLLGKVGVSTDPGESEDNGPGFFEQIGEAFASLWSGIKSVASAVWEWTKGAVSTAWDWIKGAARSAWNWIKGAATTAWNWIKGAAATAWNWMKGAASTAWNWTKRAATAAWNWTKGAARTAWNWIKGAATAAWNWTKGAARAAWDWLAGDDGFFEDAFEIIGHLTWGALGTTVGLLTTAINLTIGNLVTAIHNAFTSDTNDWAYASITIGGPNDENDIIGNYGGLFNLGGLGAALTIGPFVFFQGSAASARASGSTGVRDYFKTEPGSSIYLSRQNLHVADHEEGHEDQYLLYGPFALFFGTIFSLLPNTFGASESSGWYWFDRQANKWSGQNSPFNPNTGVHP